ncbi:hypothetical protein ACQ9ZF_03785 [Cetobacterium somerae]|uniref:hypothetical protein n=1 Tax=Cetobacterium somerae TaxID=188913 RepID=UPI003D76920C
MKIQQILEKLKNNLEIDSKEIEVLKSQLPNNTHTFIQECLENKGRVTIDDTSKICFEYYL